MTHEEIVQAIEANGGRLVASFELDEYGRTIGTGRDGRTPGERREWNRLRRCSGCGEHGHDVKRCAGPGNEPRPTHRDLRRRRA